MEIYVLDQNLDRVGVVDIYESLVWSPKYSDVGSFQLNCPIGFFSLLKEDYIIQNSMDDRHNGLIEHIEKVTNDDGVESLLVKGRMLEAILERRICFGEIYESQQPAAIASDILIRNMISPIDSKRKVENLITGATPNSDYGVVYYTSGGVSVLEAAKSLCQEAQIGFSLYVGEEKNMIFDMYKGTNRTEEDNIETEIVTVSINNLLTNGQFSGISGWSTRGNAGYGIRHRPPPQEDSPIAPQGLTVTGGIVTKTKNYDDYSAWPGYSPPYIVWNPSPSVQQTVRLNQNHIYYMAVEVDNRTNSIVGFGIDSIMRTGKTTRFIRLDTYYVPSKTGSYTFYAGTGDLAEERNQLVYFKSAVLIDLTATFGVGREPDLNFVSRNIYYSNGWKYKKEITSFIPNANDPLVFSRDRDTLVEIEYYKNNTNERNVLYINGEGLNTVIDEAKEGLSRKEMFIDLSNISREMSGIIIPQPSYVAMLQREGRALLRQMVISEMIDGKYYLLSNKKYRRDFYLGDIVNCVDRIGFETSLRISGTTEVWDESGYSLTLTLGDDVPDIYETIKLVSKGAK